MATTIFNKPIDTEVNDLAAGKMDKPTNTGTANQILRSDGNGGSEWGDNPSASEIGTAVTNWLDTNVPTGTTVAIDRSLTIDGAAANSQTVGNEIESVKSALNYYVDEVIECDNLFDSTTNIVGVLKSTGEIDSTQTDFWTSDYIDIDGSPFDIRIKNYPTDGYIRIGFYNSSKVFQSRTALVLPSGQMIYQNGNISNRKYIRISMANDAETGLEVYQNTLTAVDNIARTKANNAYNIIDDSMSYKRADEVFSLISASINASTGGLNSNDKCRTAYIPCFPNKKYKVKKVQSARFAIGFIDEEPALGKVLDGFVVNNDATELVITTDSNACYLCAFAFFQTADTLTADQILDSLEFYIDISDTKSESDQFELVINNKSVYGKVNYPFRRIITATNVTSMQSVIKKDGRFYIFGEDVVARFICYGHNLEKSLPSMHHAQSVELLSDGKFLICTNDQNDDRIVFTYDFDSGETSNSFTPTLPGDTVLVFASKIDANNYYLIGRNENEINVLTFYKYDHSEGTYENIGTYTLPMTYIQGGCRVNNLFYLVSNDGYSGTADSKVIIIDSKTMGKVGEITFAGMIEVEGFHVLYDKDDDHVKAVFTDNKTGSLYEMILS